MEKFHKFFIKYYILFLLIYLLISNIILNYLKISGVYYHIINIIILIFNCFILIEYKDEIYFKNILHLFILFCLINFKSNYNALLSLITLFILSILNFNKGTFSRVVSLIMILLILMLLPSIYFIFLLSLSNPIYENTHYYCMEYEIYIYSYGAMDSFNYSVNNHRKILYIKDKLEIVYNKEIGNTKELYNKILENNKCILVGEESGHK